MDELVTITLPRWLCLLVLGLMAANIALGFVQCRIQRVLLERELKRG